MSQLFERPLAFDNITSKNGKCRFASELLYGLKHRIGESDGTVALAVPVRPSGVSHIACLVCEVTAADRLGAVRLGSDSVKVVDMYVAEVDDLQPYTLGLYARSTGTGFT